MRGKIQPTYFQEWPWTWNEAGSKLGIVNYNSLAYWFISSRNLSRNHYGILNKNSLKARFSAIGKLSGIVNLLSTCASQPSYAANGHVIAQLSRTLINALVSVDQVTSTHSSWCTCWTQWLLHLGNCVLDQALHSASLVDKTERWVLGKINLSITVTVFLPRRRTAGIRQLLWVRTLGAILRWVLLFTGVVVVAGM